VFGLHLLSDRYGFKLSAKKSVFMKDEVLVCLGSNIECTGTDAPVNTCVFQTATAGKPGPGSKTSPLTDAVGNRYIIPDGQDLRIRRGQQESRHHRGKKTTKGNFAAAWLAHGRNPRDLSYQYAIQVQPATNDPPAYKVLQRDAGAHVVSFPDSYTGYCVFDPGKVLPAGHVSAVDKPCLAMVQKAGDGLRLTVANPDLNFAVEKAPTGLDRIRNHNRYAPSRPSPVRVTLNGKWHLDGKGAKIVPGDAGRTVIEFDCVHGRSIGVLMQKKE
jgi:chondroitin-sulfate-ABC endolyase/exolyase